MRGLEQVALLPEGADRDERELDLQIALISPIMAIKGYSAPETKTASERAIALCRQTGQVSRIFPALYGRWASYVAGQIVRSEELAAEYLELAAGSARESVPRLVGHRIDGDFVPGRRARRRSPCNISTRLGPCSTADHDDDFLLDLWRRTLALLCCIYLCLAACLSGSP